MPLPARCFISTRVEGEGSPRTPQLTSCHSPEVDIGEKEQQHQRGHDQPTVDKLDKETGRMTTCRPNAQISKPPLRATDAQACKPVRLLRGHVGGHEVAVSQIRKAQGSREGLEVTQQAYEGDDAPSVLRTRTPLAHERDYAGCLLRAWHVLGSGGKAGKAPAHAFCIPVRGQVDDTHITILTGGDKG